MPTRKPDDRINSIYRTIRDSRAQEQQAGMQPMRQAGGPQRYLAPSSTLAQYRALGTTADRTYQAGRGPIGVNVESRPGSAFTKRRMGRSSDEKMADRMAMIAQARSGIPATDMGRARYGSAAEGRDITTGREIGRGRGGSGGYEGTAADDIYNSIRAAKEYQLYQNAMADGRPDVAAQHKARMGAYKAQYDAGLARLDLLKAQRAYENPPDPNAVTPTESRLQSQHERDTFSADVTPSVKSVSENKESGDPHVVLAAQKMRDAGLPGSDTAMAIQKYGELKAKIAKGGLGSISNDEDQAAFKWLLKYGLDPTADRLTEMRKEALK